RIVAMNVIEETCIAHVIDTGGEFLVAPFVFEADDVVLVVSVAEQIGIRLRGSRRLRGIGVDLAVLHLEEARCRWRTGDGLRRVVHAPSIEILAVEERLPRWARIGGDGRRVNKQARDPCNDHRRRGSHVGSTSTWTWRRRARKNWGSDPAVTR